MPKLSSCDIPPGEARDRHEHLTQMLHHARAEQARIARMMSSMRSELSFLQEMWDEGAHPIYHWEIELAKLESRYCVCKSAGPRSERRISQSERSIGYDEAKKIQLAISKLSDEQRDALIKMLGGTED